MYYRSSGNEMYSVVVSTGDIFSMSNPKKIFAGNYFLRARRRFDIHPDGDRFLMIKRPELALGEQKIFVIQNFDEELKRLVPVGRD